LKRALEHINGNTNNLAKVLKCKVNEKKLREIGLLPFKKNKWNDKNNIKRALKAITEISDNYAEFEESLNNKYFQMNGQFHFNENSPSIFHDGYLFLFTINDLNEKFLISALESYLETYLKPKIESGRID